MPASRRIGLLSVAFAALCLSACASLLPPAPGGAVPQRSQLESFALEGRFSLRHEEKSYSGHLTWQHLGDKDELLLASPFGQGIAEIVSDRAGARLTASDGKVYAANDAETLTQQVLGYPLPLTALLGWVRGRGAVGDATVADGFGRPLSLQRERWRIDYEYDNDDPQSLPGRLFVRQEGGLDLRLRIDEWRDLNHEKTVQP